VNQSILVTLRSAGILNAIFPACKIKHIVKEARVMEDRKDWKQHK
jgi:hypothetical protein